MSGPVFVVGRWSAMSLLTCSHTSSAYTEWDRVARSQKLCLREWVSTARWASSNVCIFTPFVVCSQYLYVLYTSQLGKVICQLCWQLRHVCTMYSDVMVLTASVSWHPRSGTCCHLKNI